MHTVLCAIVVVLAGILHVLETYRYYRQGFEEGYDKGLASRKEPVDGPTYSKTTYDIKTLKACYEDKADMPEVAKVALEHEIFNQVRPFIRKAVRDDGIYRGYRAEIKVVDETGIAMDAEEKT